MGKGGKIKEPQENLSYQGTLDPVAARRQRYYILAAYVVAVLLDLGSALALYAALHFLRYPTSVYDHFSLEALWDGLWLFHSDAVDLIALCVVRVVGLSVLAYIAAGYAFWEGYCQESPGGKKGKRPPPPPLPRAPSLGRKEDGDLNAPLLPKGPEGAEKEKKGDPGFGEWWNSVSYKDVILFVSFLLCTAFQVYVGAKCVSFDFSNEAVQGLLMGLGVLWINAESVTVSTLAEGSGVLGRAVAHAQRKQAAEKSIADAAAAGAINGDEGRRVLSELSAGGPAVARIGPMDSASIIAAYREGRLRGDRGVRDEKAVSPRTYLMRAIGLARQELPVICVGFFCLAITSAAGLILPNYQGRILDDVIKMNESLFRADVFFMAMYSLVTGIFGGVRGLCFSVVGKRVLKTLQDKLFNGVIIQDIAYFDATTSGELTSRLTNDVSAMAEPLNWQLSTLVRNVAALAGGVVLSFYTSWKLSMLAFTTMAPIMHITAVYSRWSRELNRKRYAVLAEANSAASEALGNIRTVRAFSTEDTEMERYKSKTLAAMTKGVRDAFAYSGAVAINNWLDLGASVLILWYGGVLVMEGRLSIGKLITFQLYWNLIQSGYQSIMSVLMSLTRASGAAQRVLSLIDALPDIDPDAGTKLSTLKGSIRLDDVHFYYQMRPEHPVLSGVQLTVDPGQVCALVGRSGGGKSTIVHLLMRFYDPIRGRVMLDGMDLRDLNLKSVHKHMGLVAQDTQMWACSVEENITYGLPTYTREQLIEVAKHANAHDFIMKFPEGYATRVGERGVRLSGGQRQRIAIARMLLRRPRVLLLDEATSALDTESEALVQSALDRLIQEGGRTIVLVAHRLSTVRNADLIGVIDKGHIVEQGTHDELVNKKGVYEKLVRRQLNRAANVLPEEASYNTEIDALLDDKAHR